MTKAELIGRHSHRTNTGVTVHIWQRDGNLIARGRWNGRQFGETLGSDETAAESRLRRTLSAIEDGSYVPPSKRSKSLIAPPGTGRLTAHELVAQFLVEKVRVVGAQTARDYRVRLTPLLEFYDTTSTRRRWPFARDIDRQFALEFHEFVAGRIVSQNGHPASEGKKISQRQIFNILDCCRSLIHWARKPEIGKLPPRYQNPFTSDIVGQRPRKDPLRPAILPVERRLELVAAMDVWQLTHLALSMVLPFRPEDVTGLLVSDIDFDRGLMTFGTRFGGRDFNKGKLTFSVPYPPELSPIVHLLRGDRNDGPMLRSRTVFDGRRLPDRLATTRCEVLHNI